MDAAGDLPEQTTPSAAPRVSTPRSRSRWSISLGGVLLFAAGAMVGFAPMRAWLYFKDKPEQVAVNVVLFDVLETENESVREAFAGAASSDIDPLETLAGRTESLHILSKPSLTTLVDEPIVLSYGTSVSPVTQPDGSVVFLPAAGAHMSFLATVRPSGKLHLRFKTTYWSSPAPGTPTPETPPELDELGVESTIAADAGEWRLVELNLPTSEHIAAKRSRWMLLRMTPQTR